MNLFHGGAILYLPTRFRHNGARFDLAHSSSMFDLDSTKC